jgi:hypothetical protein
MSRLLMTKEVPPKTWPSIKPLAPAVVETDRAALVALKTLHDYTPANSAITVESVSALEMRLRQAEEAELLADKALAAARDARTAAGWDLRNALLGVKAAVISQYGPSSDAVQAIGLKKKSDYRRPSRRAASQPS